MKKFQLAIAATMVMSSAVLPVSAMAQKKHHKIATAAVGIGAYEAAKHSHSKFARKHRFAIGVAAAIAGNKMMKHHDKKMVHHH